MNSYTCLECGAKRTKANVTKIEIFDSPWQETPTIAYACNDDRFIKEWEKTGPKLYAESCLDLLTDTSWADFRYSVCDRCLRMVILQCPSNGWHSYYRMVNDCEQVCLKCYEEMLFAEGTDRGKFWAGRLPGMFFDESNLKEHGFVEVPGFTDRFVRDVNDSRIICDEAVRLIDAGRKIVVNYESMGIGGSEGYVTLWAT